MPPVNLLDHGWIGFIAFCLLALLAFTGGLVGRILSSATDARRDALKGESERTALLTQESLTREQMLLSTLGANTSILLKLRDEMSDQKDQLCETVTRVAGHMKADDENLTALRAHVDEVAVGTQTGLAALKAAVESLQKQLAAIDRLLP